MSFFGLNREIHISTTQNSSNLRIGTRFNKRVSASRVPVTSLNDYQDILIARGATTPNNNMSVINVINPTDKTVVWKHNSITAAIRHLPDGCINIVNNDNVLSKEIETKGPITVDMPYNDQQSKKVTLDVKIKTLAYIGLDVTNDRLTKDEHVQLINLLYEYKEYFASDVSEVGIIKGWDTLPLGALPRAA